MKFGSFALLSSSGYKDKNCRPGCFVQTKVSLWQGFAIKINDPDQYKSNRMIHSSAQYGLGNSFIRTLMTLSEICFLRAVTLYQAVSYPSHLSEWSHILINTAGIFYGKENRDLYYRKSITALFISSNICCRRSEDDNSSGGKGKLISYVKETTSVSINTREVQIDFQTWHHKSTNVQILGRGLWSYIWLFSQSIFPLFFSTGMTTA